MGHENAKPLTFFQEGFPCRKWDTLLFFYGAIACVGGLQTLGYLAIMSRYLYGFSRLPRT